MEYAIKIGSGAETKTDCLILPVFAKGKLPKITAQADKALGGLLSQLGKSHDLPQAAKQTVLLPVTDDASCKRILLVGLGAEKDLSEQIYRDSVAAAITALPKHAIANATCLLAEVDVKDRDYAWRVKHVVMQTEHALYHFTDLKSKKEDKKPKLQKITFLSQAQKQLKAGKVAIAQGQAIGHGMTFAKNLSNLPGNICNPKYLANEAKKFAKKHAKVSVKILGEKEMKSLGMGAFLAVSQGSANEGQLITLQYKGGAKTQKPTVLVGKGITFDTGGISLKPSNGIAGMKYDMCGAASVFGAFTVAVELQLPINLNIVIAAAENMPSGTATRPDDIVTTMSGQTVEIGNTDAEGRLVLCDALTYCERYKPDVVIDVATLTGACIVALGSQACGLFSPDQKLADALLEAGQESFDRAWQLPVWPEYQPSIDSQFADMNNISGSYEAGSVIAACYLARFTEKFTWAHLDVAGTAHVRQTKAYATGRPVPLLSQFLIDKAGQ